MEINHPATLAQVEAVFTRYEHALVTNDVAVLDELFCDAPETVRYGIAENLYGIDAIRTFRSARPSAGLTRSLSGTIITTYGRDFATASTLFHRDAAPGKVGRQMQTWTRMAGGWRVVAAHVSIIDEPA